MAIYGADFVYNGTSLKSIDEDYMLASFDQSENVAHQRRINSSEITNDNYIQHYYGHVADTPLEFDLTITRCQEEITQEDAKKLSDWLFATSEPKVMYLVPGADDNAMYRGTDFIGAFTEMRYAEGNTAVTFHFMNISGYAFSKLQSIEVDMREADTIEIPMNGSMAGEIIYPVVRIAPVSSGTLDIIMQGGDTFSVDIQNGNNFVINDRNLFYEDGSLCSFDNLNNFNWPYLLNGNNVWTLSGSGVAIVTVETRHLVTTGY